MYAAVASRPLEMNCVHCATPLPGGSRYCPTCGADSSDPSLGPKTDPGSFSNLGVRLQAVVGDRYDIKQMLGHGGMGAVFLATERKLDRPVAIKVLPPDYSYNEKLVRRFQREARTAARLDHPNIIPIYSVEDDDDLDYFVMKYITGHSLATELDAGDISVERAQQILWESAGALGHAHQREVVHRDVKPGNIMIDDSGRAMLTDFGISKAHEASTQFTATGQVIGTPFYMSPEQAKGQPVDGRSDQYSLAVVGFRMLTNRLPFEDDSVHAVIYKQIFEDPPALKELRPEVPDSLAEAIHRAMAKDPDERFESMAEFGAAVSPENPLGAVGQARRPSSQAKTVHRRRTLVGAVAAAMVIAAAGGWAAIQGARERSAESSTAAGESSAAAAVDAGPTEPVAAVRSAAEMPAAAPPPQSAPATTPPSELAAVGYLTVNSEPWGTVYIDGIEIRNAPLARYELRPGRYVVEVRRAGYQTYVDSAVVVTAGNPTRRGYVLVRLPG